MTHYLSFDRFLKSFILPFYFKVKVSHCNNSGNASFVKHLLKNVLNVFCILFKLGYFTLIVCFMFGSHCWQSFDHLFSFLFYVYKKRLKIY